MNANIYDTKDYEENADMGYEKTKPIKANIEAQRKSRPLGNHLEGKANLSRRLVSSKLQRRRKPRACAQGAKPDQNQLPVQLHLLKKFLKFSTPQADNR
jgi:hypothetical protein